MDASEIMRQARVEAEMLKAIRDQVAGFGVEDPETLAKLVMQLEDVKAAIRAYVLCLRMGREFAVQAAKGL